MRGGHQFEIIKVEDCSGDKEHSYSKLDAGGRRQAEKDKQIALFKIIEIGRDYHLQAVQFGRFKRAIQISPC